MAASGDPVGAAVVTGLARPGGNVTGLTALTVEVSGKRLQLLKEAIPRARRVAAVLDRGAPMTQRRATEQAARSIGLRPQVLYIEKAEDLGPAFDAAVKQRADAVSWGLARCSRAMSAACRVGSKAPAPLGVQLARVRGRRRPHGLRCELS
jgi:putative ABC transport system substrate-binding protein